MVEAAPGVGEGQGRPEGEAQKEAGVKAASRDRVTRANPRLTRGRDREAARVAFARCAGRGATGRVRGWGGGRGNGRTGEDRPRGRVSEVHSPRPRPVARVGSLARLMTERPIGQAAANPRSGLEEWSRRGRGKERAEAARRPRGETSPPIHEPSPRPRF